MKRVSTLDKIKITISLFGVLGIWFLIHSVTNFSYEADRTFVANYEFIKDLDKETVRKFDSSEGHEIFYSYVPAYSHVYTAEGDPVNMAITLSLRNVDTNSTLNILEVAYHDTKGKLIRRYLKEGYALSPLETKEIFVTESDVEGGSGANFVIIFSNQKMSLPPIFETIMSMDSTGREAYTFSSRGVHYLISK